MNKNELLAENTTQTEKKDISDLGPVPEPPKISKDNTRLIINDYGQLSAEQKRTILLCLVNNDVAFDFEKKRSLF